VVAAVETAVTRGELSLLPRTTDQFAAVTGGARIGLAEAAGEALVRD